MTTRSVPDLRSTPVERDLREARTHVYAAERRIGELAQMLAIATELHLAPDGWAVIDIVKETVANLIGCEALAVYRVLPDTSDLALVDAIGVDPVTCSILSSELPWVGTMLRTRRPVIAHPGDQGWEVHGHRVTATIPFVTDAGVDGCLVLFELLVQKSALVDEDEELLVFLARHAAHALDTSGSRPSWPDPIG